MSRKRTTPPPVDSRLAALTVLRTAHNVNVDAVVAARAAYETADIGMKAPADRRVLAAEATATKSHRAYWTYRKEHA